jgi:hypothetical protein
MNLPGGVLFAHKDKICRFSQNADKIQVDIADVASLDFHSIGHIDIRMKGAAFIKLT